MYETEEDKIINDNLPQIYNDNLDIGIVGLNNRFTRISIVCYLRGELKNCKMKLDPELLKPIPASVHNTSVFFINKLVDSEKRKKYYTSSWSHCYTHEEALTRIIKHNMKNVIITDDNFDMIKKTPGDVKKFKFRDGITFLDNLKELPKGIHPISEKRDKLVYFVPDSQIAVKLLVGKNIPKYEISPPLFKTDTFS